jgi:two-component system sensor histidine kinase DegS
MVTRRFTQRYILALALVASLTIVGQVLVQRQLRNQTADSYLVNYAGKQRYQSQQIVKDALLMTRSDGLEASRNIAANLQQVLSRWERYHYELKTGQLTDLHAVVHNSKAIQALFAQLDPDFKAISQAARQLLLSRVNSAGVTDNQQQLRIILNHDISFLERMDGIVRQYEEESEAKVDRLHGIEQALMAITLFVLLLEALLIFQPAVQTLRDTVRQLTLSEYQTRLINEDLQQSHQSLKLAQTQLMREANLRYQQRLDEQRIRLSSVVQGQEDERKRLSRELHDGIGQMLTGLKLLAENIRSSGNLSEKDQTTFVSLKTLLIRTIQETRNVSNNLMPPVLGDFGLVSALRQLTEQQDKQSGTSVTLRTSLTNERFGQPVEIGLYRIVQEAVNNAIKHAGASEIDVCLEQRHDRLYLRIADDGCGIGTGPKRSTAQGLHNMRERARLLDGTFRLTTRPDRCAIGLYQSGKVRSRLIRLGTTQATTLRPGTRVLVCIPILEPSVYNVATLAPQPSAILH